MESLNLHDPFELKAFRQRSLEALSRVASHDDGVVYAVGNRHQRILKIGYSSNRYDRRNSIQTGSPFEIETFAAVQGDLELEGRLHCLLADFHWRGEWFFLSRKAEVLIELMRAKQDSEAQNAQLLAAQAWDCRQLHRAT
jgi:hypothetical protein